jgi:tetratricopeptide (TPR) repeat protein
MKTIKLLFCIGIIACSIQQTIAQTDKTATAFSSSYDKETKKDYTSAIAAIQGVYDAKSYEINLRLGWLYYEAGQYKESIGSYKIAIDLMPYSIEAKLGYVYPAAALGNMDDVANQYTAILAIDPQNTTANYRMGYIYYDKKDYATAYKYFEKVVNLYPFSYDGLLMYAWTNYQMGKTREAKILFEKVIWLSPGDKSATEGVSLIK